MTLADAVYVEPRFQRAIRIDTDLTQGDALAGYICPESSANVLEQMADHIISTKQASFTWTGPYGSGKSSLVIALSRLLDADPRRREQAGDIVGTETAAKIWQAMPPHGGGWEIIPVVGQRAQAEDIIGTTLVKQGIAKAKPKGGWNSVNIAERLVKHAEAKPDGSGVLLFVDEMGKLLEASARQGSDLYLFQNLAELAARSNGKLIFVGVLHQAFEEYANRLSREARDEWSKIQGRFIDLAVNTAGEEQIDLLARAIQVEGQAKPVSKSAVITANTIKTHRPGVSEELDKLLAKTWPLHPVVSALLGPLSRRRFGQNQRSIFGFLNSAEPKGFQDYLKQNDGSELYGPALLWDYLRINLEPAITASPDGHRWTMAAEAVDRSEAMGLSELHTKVLKTIAIIDLFRERSGLYPTSEVLQVSVDAPKAKVTAALKELKKGSFIIFRDHISAYAIYAGSDFDIEAATQRALEASDEIDFKGLVELAGIQPILAKRHYFRTGALRWFDVQLVAIKDLNAAVDEFTPHEGTVGLFLVGLPTEGETENSATRLSKEATSRAQDAGKDIIVGYPNQAWVIIELFKELEALQTVLETDTTVQGDPVARKELKTRILEFQNRLEAELQQAFEASRWFQHGAKLAISGLRELNNEASKVADRLYRLSPIIKNELLNRAKPSGSAIAAQNALLKCMANNIGERRLGIEDYPAEGGLYEALLEATKIYRKNSFRLDFNRPTGKFDSANLEPAWHEATQYLKKNSYRSVSLAEIFDRWAGSPYGIKRGLMPILGAAYLLSMRDDIAVYREGIFQPYIQSLDLELMARDPNDIQTRWMDLRHLSKNLISGLAELVRELDPDNPLTELAPIDVARGLVSIFDRVPNWAKRTQKLSKNAIKVRTILKGASDPNQLLFSDLPGVYQSGADINDAKVSEAVVEVVTESLKELVDAYPKMLSRLSTVLLDELHVPSNSPQAIAELRQRGENIKKISGDFRLDAFINRVASFDGSTQSIEGIGSLAANKPPRDWVDSDLDRAMIEVAALCQQFVRTETYARVQGRKDNRHAMAVIVSRGDRPQPIEVAFEVSDSDSEAIDVLTSKINQMLQEQGADHEFILAALARASGNAIESYQAAAQQPSLAEERNEPG